MLNKYEVSKMHHRSVHYGVVANTRITQVLTLAALIAAVWFGARYEAVVGKVKPFLFQVTPFGQVVEMGEAAQLIPDEQATQFFLQYFLRALREQSRDARFAAKRERDLRLMVDASNLHIFRQAILDPENRARCERDVMVLSLLPVGEGAERHWQAHWREVELCGNYEYQREFTAFLAVEKRKKSLSGASLANPLGLVVTTMKHQELHEQRKRELVRERM